MMSRVFTQTYIHTDRQTDVFIAARSTDAWTTTLVIDEAEAKKAGMLLDLTNIELGTHTQQISRIRRRRGTDGGADDLDDLCRRRRLRRQDDA